MSKIIRTQMRRLRKSVTPYQHAHSANQILTHLLDCAQFRHSQKIGVYLDAFGEIQTRQIILRSFNLGKAVYLPKVSSVNQTLRWVKISKHQFLNKRFAPHQLGMLEPMQQRGVSVDKLDLLLMPLLACDPKGHRIGMGGGFYDRTLTQHPVIPFRLGLAHDFQLLQDIFTVQPWDQALHGLITPSKLYYFK